MTCLLAALLTSACSGKYEQMYPRTEAGQVEIKTLPERISLETKPKANYFARDDAHFMKLFRYIGDNDLAMTTPVEAEIDPGTMRFFVGDKASGRALSNSEDVRVAAIPSSEVLSVGITGAYSERNFRRGVQVLDEWLEAHPETSVSGKPYAVYWDGPFVPDRFKKSEVHYKISQP